MVEGRGGVRQRELRQMEPQCNTDTVSLLSFITTAWADDSALPLGAAALAGVLE